MLIIKNQSEKESITAIQNKKKVRKVIPVLQRYVDAQKSKKKKRIIYEDELDGYHNYEPESPSEEEQEDDNDIEVKRKRKPEQKTCEKQKKVKRELKNQ